jgi:NAD(P)-dependent dehydrogenase (short-subunit alcohol dehydrogenase family)
MPDLTFTLPSDFTYPGIAPSPPGSTGVRNQLSRYAVSKSANILFASELQRRMDAENIPIISTSLHPGLIATEGQARLSFGLLGPVWWLMKTIGSGSPEKGAVPSLYLAAAGEVKERKGDFAGRYFEPSLKAVAPSNLASDPKFARNLWELSEETVRKWTAT